MNLSDFYGKRAESKDGRSGYVISVNGCGGKVVCLVCADDDEKEFIIDVKNILSLGESIIFDDRESAIKNSVPLRLGKPVFNCDGKYLGALGDFICDGYRLNAAVVGKRKFSANEFVCGDAVIIKHQARVLKSDVKKDGRVILRRGTCVTPEALEKAQKEGEYIQTNLKTI